MLSALLMAILILLKMYMDVINLVQLKISFIIDKNTFKLIKVAKLFSSLREARMGGAKNWASAIQTKSSEIFH